MRLGCGLPKPGKVSGGDGIMCDGTGVCYRIDWDVIIFCFGRLWLKH